MEYHSWEIVEHYGSTGLISPWNGRCLAVAQQRLKSFKAATSVNLPRNTSIVNHILFICIYIYTHICIGVCVCVHVHMYTPICVCVYVHTYTGKNLCRYVYMIYDICLSTWSHADICPWDICWFRHFSMFKFCNPYRTLWLCVKMKVTFRCGFGSHMFVLYWYLQVFMFFSLPASISLKPSFYICSPGSFQVTWSFQYLSQLFGQVGMVNCFATRSPKHMTLAFQQCHLQVCLWRHQGSTHCVPATTTPRFLPGSHLLRELIFVMWDMFF